jgi:hypothetical protein
MSKRTLRRAIRQKLRIKHFDAPRTRSDQLMMQIEE